MRKEHPLRRTLRERRISQNKLARELSISPAYLSRILGGKRRLGIENGLRIARLLGIPLEDLYA